MEWKEFVLIIFGGFTLIVFLFTAQSLFMLSKLEKVEVSFQIEPETLEVINNLKNNTSNNIQDNVLVNLEEIRVSNNCGTSVYFSNYESNNPTLWCIVKNCDSHGYCKETTIELIKGQN